MASLNNLKEHLDCLLGMHVRTEKIFRKREARRFVLKVHQKCFRVSLSQFVKTAIDSRARKPRDFSWTAFRPRHRCASRRPRHRLSSI